MKKTAIGIAALAALLATPALAADLYRPAPIYKAPPAAVPAAYSWTGFYIGLNGGYGWNQSTGDSYCITPGGVLNGVGCDTPNTGVVKPGGGLFGGQAGYNLQSGSIVYGLETDIQWSGIKGSGSAIDLCCNPAAVPLGTFSASSKLDWFGTARGRFGVLASSNALLYATGGLIYGRESVSNVLTFPLVSYPASATTTRAGWTVGGGLEFAFTGNLSGKIEGLYYDMGSVTDAFTSPLTGYTEGAKYNFTGGIIRAGLNYHFGGGPVVTRY